MGAGDEPAGKVLHREVGGIQGKQKTGWGGARRTPARRVVPLNSPGPVVQHPLGGQVPRPSPRSPFHKSVWSGILDGYLIQRSRRYQGGSKRLSEVIIHEDENFERALKRFKKKCEKAGILSDLRKHRHYEKPSERRKRKMNAAMRKNRRTRPN